MKAELRAQLVREQRGLCCFCGASIRNDPRHIKIAHWFPQSAWESLPSNERRSFPSPLDYGNLLGACRGGEGEMSHNQHCDTHQGNNRLSRNPADPSHYVEQVIKFPLDGSIRSTDPRFNRDLGALRWDGTFDRGVLNLNLPRLRSVRRAKLDAFVKGTKSWGRNHLRRCLADLRDPRGGELDAYAPVVAYYIEKKLRA